MSTSFADKLSALLAAHGWSYQDAADVAGTSKGTVERWLNKGKLPRLDQARALALRLGVTTDYLADDAQDSPPVVTDRGRQIAEIVGKLGEEQALDRLRLIPHGGAAGNPGHPPLRRPAPVSPIPSIEVRGVRSAATPVARPPGIPGHRRRG